MSVINYRCSNNTSHIIQDKIRNILGGHGRHISATEDSWSTTAALLRPAPGGSIAT